MPTEWLEMMVPARLQWVRPDSVDESGERPVVRWEAHGAEEAFSLPVTEREAAWFKELPPPGEA